MARTGWTLGALLGSLAAGGAITALMISGERKTGTPSELIALGRDCARKAGFGAPDDDALPSDSEQLWTQGGHLALSAAAGLAYAALLEQDAPVIASGVGFGLAFYTAAHVIGGPALGVKAPEWRQPAGAIGQHIVIHIAFGVATAMGARLGAILAD